MTYYAFNYDREKLVHGQQKVNVFRKYSTSMRIIKLFE